MVVTKFAPLAVRLARGLPVNRLSTLQLRSVTGPSFASFSSEGPTKGTEVPKAGSTSSEVAVSPKGTDVATQGSEAAATAKRLGEVAMGPELVNLNLDPHAEPVQRVYQILRNDFRHLAEGKFIINDDQYFPTYCDIAIVGGGIIGSSIAYFLKQRARKGLRIAVIEKDLSYAKSSTALSAGGIRQQFSLPENIQMSKFGAEFLRTIKSTLAVPDRDPPEIYFNPQGYLFLANDENVETLRENHRVQTDCGVNVDLLTARQLKMKFPWLNTDGIALGSYGYGQEGWFDPYLLLMAFKEKAMSLGVQYINAELVGFQFTANSEEEQPDEGERHLHKLVKLVVKMKDGIPREINPAFTYLTCGANTGIVGQLASVGCGPGMLKYPIPVEPRKRYVYSFHCPDGPGIECPLVIDSTGSYFRREGFGGHYICGKSPGPKDEPDCSSLEVDYSYFDEHVWPDIANRVPAFENIKLQNAWAGFYDYNTFDQNAIIGPHPYFPNLLMATGFSGHGLQQAPAIGRALAEYFIDGKFMTIDLSRFFFDRILMDQPVFERNIV